MPSGPLPTCECIGSYCPNIVQQWIFCALLAQTAAIEAASSGEAAGTFDTTNVTATGNGSIPAGVLGWSITAIAGTVTVGGAALAVGGSVGGGGYGGKVTATAKAYTVSGGSALVVYDTPTP